MTQAEIKTLVTERLPELDDAIVEYVASIVQQCPEEEQDHLAWPVYLQDTVGPLLAEGRLGDEGDVVGDLCHAMAALLRNAKGVQDQGEVEATDGPRVIKKLDTPIHMEDVTVLDMTLIHEKVDLTHVASKRGAKRPNAQNIDMARLKRLEAKAALKLERREREKMALELKAAALKLDALGEEGTSSKGTKAPQHAFIPGAASGKDSKVRDVRVENFDISFAGKKILTDAKLMLANGRRYGLVGRNGEGKSTLLRHISSRQIPIPSGISILHVEQEVVGDETSALHSVLSADTVRETLLADEKRIQEELDVIPDDDPKRSKLSNALKKVYTQLEDIEADKAESRASIILIGLGFDKDMQARPTKSFSGGWRMRIALARSLFCKPDLLLLDEPTNMLDIPAVAWLEEYLLEWPNTLLVVSHDRTFLDAVTTDILHLHHEQLDAYKGNYSNFVGTREERVTNQIREYESQALYRKNLQDFIDRWRYNAKRAAQAQSKIKILEKLPVLRKPAREEKIKFTFSSPEKLSPPILQMTDVKFAYEGTDRNILSNVHFNLDLDTRIAVVGPNGAGKTTFLKLMIGALEPSNGSVFRHGRLKFAFFSQHHVDQLDVGASSVGFLRAKFPGNSEEVYRGTLGQFGLHGTTALQPIHTLSGGQKSRVVFAALSMMRPHVLILDEPTNHLDMDSIDALADAIDRYDGGVVVVSHDEKFVKKVCQEIWVINGGSCSKFYGDMKEYKKTLKIEV